MLFRFKSYVATRYYYLRGDFKVFDAMRITFSIKMLWQKPCVKRWWQQYFYSVRLGKYSGGSISECSYTESIQNPNIIMFWFQMVPFANIHIHCLCTGMDHLKTKLTKWWLAQTVLYIKQSRLAASLKSLDFEWSGP